LHSVAAKLGQKARLGGLFVLLLLFAGAAAAQDYVKEKRWSDDILKTLMVGDAVWLEQKNGHKFLGLFIDKKEKARGAVVIAHGRGWSPDFELYGTLRTLIAEQGYSTLSIQMPVLPSTAILGLYVPLYPDARERFQLAVDYLKAKGYKNIAIVSHSLGATMANQYLIRTEDTTVGAWVSISILQGLQEMFRIKIPVLDVFASDDWSTNVYGAPERAKEISSVPGSSQVMIQNAKHFFEGREEELVRVVVSFLDSAFKNKKN
jgi:alpha-beta hydrolase superfamily lysophospholipase